MCLKNEKRQNIDSKNYKSAASLFKLYKERLSLDSQFSEFLQAKQEKQKDTISAKRDLLFASTNVKQTENARRRQSSKDRTDNQCNHSQNA